METVVDVLVIHLQIAYLHFRLGQTTLQPTTGDVTPRFHVLKLGLQEGQPRGTVAAKLAGPVPIGPDHVFSDGH